jgi:hypothetical protein
MKLITRPHDRLILDEAENERNLIAMLSFQGMDYKYRYTKSFLRFLPLFLKGVFPWANNTRSSPVIYT